MVALPGKLELACLHTASNCLKIDTIAGRRGMKDAIVPVNVEHEFVHLAIPACEIAVRPGQPTQDLKPISAKSPGIPQIGRKFFFPHLDKGR